MTPRVPARTQPGLDRGKRADRPMPTDRPAPADRRAKSAALVTLVAVALLAAACGPSNSTVAPNTNGSAAPSAAAPSAVAPSAAAAPGESAAGTPSGESTVAASRVPLPTGRALIPQAYASRVTVPSRKIDLPIVSGDLLPPPNYPYCDVALYVTRFGQPDEPGVTYLTAHAQKGMFLPLLQASLQNDGRGLLGEEVNVYTSDSMRYRYTITQVIRHALDYGVVTQLDLEQRNLILQTSEGPTGTPGKLQIVAAPVGEPEPVDEAEANPEAKPRDCDPAKTDAGGATEAPAPTPIVVTAPSPSP